MKQVLVWGLGGILALALAASGAVWFVPQVQDALLKRFALVQVKASNAALLDDGALHVILCGTGSPMIDQTRADACTLVIAGGHMVAIDAGPGSWAKIAGMRLPADRLDAVLLTHLHSDHIGDLGEFALQSWVNGRKGPLDVFGPEGTQRVVAGFQEAYAPDTGYRVAHHGADHIPAQAAGMTAHVVDLAEPEAMQTVFDRDGLKIEAFLVDHRPIKPAFGYRIEYEGRVAVVSGDTVKTPSMARAAKGADLLVHEALDRHMVSMLADTLREVGNDRLADMVHDTLNYHTAPVEAAEIARDAGVRLLVYSHFVPPVQNALMERIFMRGVEAARGPGKTMLGYDGLAITLPKASKAIELCDLL